MQTRLDSQKSENEGTIVIPALVLLHDSSEAVPETELHRTRESKRLQARDLADTAAGQVIDRKAAIHVVSNRAGEPSRRNRTLFICQV